MNEATSALSSIVDKRYNFVVDLYVVECVVFVVVVVWREPIGDVGRAFHLRLDLDWLSPLEVGNASADADVS